MQSFMEIGPLGSENKRDIGQIWWFIIRFWFLRDKTFECQNFWSTLIKSSVLFTQWMMSIHLKANYTFPPLFRIILCLSFHRAVGPFASQLALNMHSKQILNTIFHLIVVAILPKRHQKPFRRLREHHRPQLVILWLLIKSGYRIRLRAQGYYSYSWCVFSSSDWLLLQSDY